MADIDDVIMTIIAEAIGEGDEGMRRVGETVLNRAAIRGISPAEVVRQANQYTGYSAPGPAARAAQKDPLSVAAAQAAWELARQPGDPTNGADHYHADYVSPNWANSMPSTGSYGKHQYYSSQPVPVEALAALLAPSTREVAFPRARPETRQVDLPRSRPQSPGDLMASMFGTSFSAPQDAATSAGLSNFLGRQIGAGGNLTMPGQIDRSIGSLNQKSGLAEALAAMVAPRSIPAMPTGAKQSYAGQDSLLAERVHQIAEVFGAGGDTGAKVGGQVLAAVPTSNIGKPPTTRAVQSVPVIAPAPRQTTAQIRADNGQARPAASPKATTTTQRPTALTIGAVPNFAGQDRAVPNKINGVEAAPAFGDLAMMFGNTPQATGSVNNKKANERLPSGGAWTISEAERNALHGIDKPAQAKVTNTVEQVPLPRRRPDTAQKTQVAITAPKKVAPTPAAAARRPQASILPVPPTPKRQIVPTAPLKIIVQGGNYQAPGSGAWAPQGYTNDGTGRITSNETGGVYYERHLR